APFPVHPHASRVDDALALVCAIELHVSVSADDDVLLHSAENLAESPSGRELRDDVLVAAWRPVAEERLSETVDVDCQRCGERCEKVSLGFRDQPRGPLGAAPPDVVLADVLAKH